MHFNPCGRAVDWIQFPFEVDARVHDSVDAPIVRLRWVYTDLPFLPVGTGSVINNRVWNKDQISELTVGQLPLLESRYKQDARWRLPAGLVAGHLCHPEWFSTGEPWPSDLPPAVYGLYGIPECCGLFQEPTEGGMEIGGEEPVPPAPCPEQTTTCAAAPPGQLELFCAYALPASVELWRRWPLDLGEDYEIAAIGLGTAGQSATFVFWVGSDCGDLDFLGSFAAVDGNFSHTFTATTVNVWLQAFGGATPQNYQIRVRAL